MLEMRLDLLELFFEMGVSCPQPHFQPGEITMMNMSCPFVDANTACILFRIGLNRYLQSRGNAKMVVLDEAHKVRSHDTHPSLVLELTLCGICWTPQAQSL
jgi:hypothetical protein